MTTRFTNPGLEGNPHFADLICLSQPGDEQIAATLALAYEQRTATLVALWRVFASADEEGMHGVDYDKLEEQIKGRLGL